MSKFSASKGVISHLPLPPVPVRKTLHGGEHDTEVVIFSFFFFQCKGVWSTMILSARSNDLTYRLQSRVTSSGATINSWMIQFILFFILVCLFLFCCCFCCCCCWPVCWCVLSSLCCCCHCFSLFLFCFCFFFVCFFVFGPEKKCSFNVGEDRGKL